MQHNTSIDSQFDFDLHSHTMDTTCFLSLPPLFSTSSSTTPALALKKHTDEKGYRSIHITRPVAAGNTIAYFIGELMPHSTRHTVQMDENIHIHSEDGPAYINHSCMPTAYLTSDPAEKTAMVLVALRDLKEGDELTCNFNATELISGAPFKCHCNHEKCVGTVRGFDYLTEEQRAHLLATTRVSPYVEMVYKNKQQQDKH